jgi:hypothetical protein
MIRAGTCSMCGIALESPDGGPEGTRARSRAVRAQPGGHHHARPWRCVPDGVEEGSRAWHDFAPNFLRPES